MKIKPCWRKYFLTFISIGIAIVFLISSVSSIAYGQSLLLKNSVEKTQEINVTVKATSQPSVSIPLSGNTSLGFKEKTFSEDLSAKYGAAFSSVSFGYLNESLWIGAASNEIIVSPNNVANATSPSGIGIGIGIWTQGSLWTYVYCSSPTYYNGGTPIIYYTVIVVEKGTTVTFQVPLQINKYGGARILLPIYWWQKAPKGTKINIWNPTLFRDAELLAINACTGMLLDLTLYGEIPYWVYLVVESLELIENCYLGQSSQETGSPIYLPPGSKTMMEFLKQYSLSSIEATNVPENSSTIFDIYFCLDPQSLYEWMSNGGSWAPINVTVSVPVKIELLTSDGTAIYTQTTTVSLKGTFWIVNENNLGNGGGVGGHGTYQDSYLSQLIKASQALKTLK